jgi:hypothetical protein
MWSRSVLLHSRVYPEFSMVCQDQVEGIAAMAIKITAWAEKN